MRRSNRDVFIWSLTLILLASACGGDPGYQGQSSRRWIDLLQTGETPQARVNAAMALGRVLEVRPDFPDVVNALARAVQDTSDAVRLAAATALTAKGVDPKAALSGIHAILHDTLHAEVRESITLIIGSLGEKRAVALLPTLREAMADPSPRVRAAAVTAIGAITSRESGDARLIAGLADDSATEVRLAVPRALSALNADTVITLSAMKVLLRDSSPDVRAAAALGVASVGPAAVRVLPEVIELFQDPQVAVVRNALYAVSAMGTVARSAIPALRKLAKAPDARISKDAADAIAILEGRRQAGTYSEPTGLEKCREGSADPRC